MAFDILIEIADMSMHSTDSVTDKRCIKNINPTNNIDNFGHLLRITK